MAVPPHYNSIKDYFEDVLNFLRAYRWVYDSPNTHILVNKVFKQVPVTWLPFLKNLRTEELNVLSLGKHLENMPDSLEKFLQEVSDLKFTALEKKMDVNFQFPNNSRLSKKKEHEIISLAPLVHEICVDSGCDFIIDVGTGLGYLPQLLHEKYNYSVLGIEGNPDKVRLAKINQAKYPKSADFIKYIEHFVTDKSEEQIREMVKGIFMKYACVTGLHACADLSVTILELFARLEFAKSLVIMPCCYHRLKQNEHGFENFPASSLLKELSRKFGTQDFLQVPFLRLACQGSVDEFSNMTEEQHKEHANSCLFRAILQEVAESEKCQVRRLRRKSGKLKQSSSITETFEAYLTNLKHTHALIGAEITDDGFLKKMREKWSQHKENAYLIEALAAFQAAIQNICENIVLLDRVEFLKEKGVDCFVAKVTDQGISPRCHALVAVKP